MISKEKFIEYMNELQELNDTYDAINEVAKELEMFSLYSIEYEAIILDILKTVFKDKNDWIGYFIFELDFGRKYEDGMIEFDDIPIPMRNAGELYDVLIENMNND